MSNILGTMFAKAKNTLTQTAETVRNSMLANKEGATISVIGLADYIETHQDTKKATQFLLGDFYHFYVLEAEGIHYYLEKKSDYILQLDASMDDQILVAYRSYRDKQHLQEMFSFPIQK
ncbi:MULTISPECIES: hypothetical protein [Bacillaceae]|uniref:hypothetical protein n=1 Tax=Bacillaceae TaxID=186817 RepID=UPI001E5CB3FC|nr:MULTISPECIES: hypothetical protein [Bacillaceae]MCE4047723.1 hypothetical protein [Bacillus sp. Au-Bac7]MCM3031170.1 hypothetical protein [Niallia sp. MER 6]